MNRTIVENFPIYEKQLHIYIYFSPFHLTELWLAVFKTLLSTALNIFIKPENTLISSVLSEDNSDGLLIIKY